MPTMIPPPGLHPHARARARERAGRRPRWRLVPFVAMAAALALVALPLAAPAAAGMPRQLEPSGASGDAGGGTSAATWEWPTDAPHRVIRPFVAPASDYGAGHRGVDLAAGSELLAPADGVVHFAGVVVDRGVLSIDQADGVLSSFEPVTTRLHAGDIVHRGDVLGEIDAGHCSVPCLHVGARVAGEYVSPLLYLGGAERAVLLPTRRIDG